LSQTTGAAPADDNVLYEEIFPIYETPATNVVCRDFESRLTMDQQDLFTHMDTTFTHSNSECITRGIQLVDNEAYSHSTKDQTIITKTTDDSCSTAEHDYDVCSTSSDPVEGEPLYDDTVI
jgi:arginine deiminase